MLTEDDRSAPSTRQPACSQTSTAIIPPRRAICPVPADGQIQAGMRNHNSRVPCIEQACYSIHERHTVHRASRGQARYNASLCNTHSTEQALAICAKGKQAGTLQCKSLQYTQEALPRRHRVSSFSISKSRIQLLQSDCIMDSGIITRLPCKVLNCTRW